LENDDIYGITSDAFVAKIDKDGVWQWSAKIAGSDSSNQGTGISARPDGVDVTGQYKSNLLSFYNNQETNPKSELNLEYSNSGSDMFVAKIKDGVWQWSARIAGTSFDYTNQGNFISATSNGVYVTGYYYSTTLSFYDYQDTNPKNNLKLKNNGYVNTYDAFVAKIDNNYGIWEWSARIAGSKDDEGLGISAGYAESDGVYVTGYYNSTTLSFYNYNDTNPKFDLTNDDTNGGSYDAFVAKINKDGVWQWSARIAGKSYDLGNGISAGPDGVYVNGHYISNLLSFYDYQDTNPKLDLEYDTNNFPTSDAFVAKIGNDGKWVWSARIAGSKDDKGLGISAGSDGVYVTGFYYSTTLRFYDHQETIPKFDLENDDSNGNTSDAFVAKINKDGVWQWSAKIAGSNDDKGKSISAGSDGVYVTGNYKSNPLSFYDYQDTNPNLELNLTNSGSTDLFVAKIRDCK
jgi:hypothetical protein